MEIIFRHIFCSSQIINIFNSISNHSTHTHTHTLYLIIFILILFYTLSINNLGKERVKLKNRFWKIIDSNGIKHEVKGEGVVGKQPVLNPGEKFEYTSGTPLSTPSGFMEGHYEMETINGGRFDASIPLFSLDSPFISDQVN